MKKITAIVGILLILSVSLAFARAGTQQSGGSQSSGSGDLRYRGTITMYAGSYSPDTPTATSPNPPTKLREIAAAWQARNPGITIDFMPNLEAAGSADYVTWLRTRLAGGSAPDIFFAHCTDLTGGTIPTGSFYQLNQYLERPNKYIPGNRRWLDTFQKALVQQTSGSNGEIYNINADYVATLTVYNVALFRRAGINFEIKTWSDYTRACQMLKAAGITPWAWAFGGGDEATINWFTRLYGTNLYYPDFEKLAVIGGKDALSLSPLEVAIGVKNGYFTSADPRFIGFLANFKDHIDNYMPRDVVSSAVNGQTVFSMFVNQQVAMNWNGSWVGNSLRDAGVTWEYATFPWPIPDRASSPQATTFDSSPAAGGPFAAFQYAISTPRANTTMNNDKLEAVLDWLMFITTPENNAAIVNDVGSMIPTIIGAPQLPANTALVSMLEAEPKVIDIGVYSLGPEATETFYREWVVYAQGNQTLEQMGRRLDAVFSRAADEVIANSGVDVSRYLIRR